MPWPPGSAGGCQLSVSEPCPKAASPAPGVADGLSGADGALQVLPVTDPHADQPARFRARTAKA
jgi:hypothetical protein